MRKIQWCSHTKELIYDVFLMLECFINCGSFIISSQHTSREFENARMRFLTRA
jgi:hypothetical protein